MGRAVTFVALAIVVLLLRGFVARSHSLSSGGPKIADAPQLAR
jgi:hypothetical protein